MGMRSQQSGDHDGSSYKTFESILAAPALNAMTPVPFITAYYPTYILFPLYLQITYFRLRAKRDAIINFNAIPS